MATVFPEKMNKVDFNNLKDAVKVMEAYMRYMCERTEYAVNNVSKVAAKAGNIGTEYIVQLENMQNEYSVLSNNINLVTADLANAVERMNIIADDVEFINSDLAAIKVKCEDFEKRISALEKANAEEETM